MKTLDKKTNKELPDIKTGLKVALVATYLSALYVVGSLDSGTWDVTSCKYWNRCEDSSVKNNYESNLKYNGESDVKSKLDLEGIKIDVE